jgi:NADH dehydrogenase
MEAPAMADSSFDVVTGAFGYIGRYIARCLLDAGRSAKTLTRNPCRPNPFGERVAALPYRFDRPDELTASLRGADTLYNTYWVRFEHAGARFDRAIANTITLLRAAEAAGVRRLVHISVTNPSLASPLPYYRGKAVLEEFIARTRLSHAILRPAVVFGPEDILVNNIAWLLRKLPVFVIPGRGDYRLQPVFVEDLARLAVDAGRRGDNVVLDTVGPETFTFDELVRLLAKAVGSRARIIHAPPAVPLLIARFLGPLVGDVLLTRDELAGLMTNLLVSQPNGASRTHPTHSQHAPTCPTAFSAWLATHAGRLGRAYASELARHYRHGQRGH